MTSDSKSHYLRQIRIHRTFAMGWTMNLILLLSGLSSLSSCVRQHQYFLVNTPQTWYEAQSYCREKCFDLATVDDMEEMETGLKAVEGKYDDAVWIGLQRGETEKWHWSLANKELYKEGERDYLIWAGNKQSKCGLYLQGELYSDNCGTAAFSVCFDGKKQGREQYVLCTKVMRWRAAQDYCRAHYTDLASVRNEEENQMIKEVTDGKWAWVGLFQDTWIWSDRTYSSFRYWKLSNPFPSNIANGCAALSKADSGRWQERDCEERHPFLCNCPVVRIIKVTMSSQDSGLDLNDPAVLDDMLKQIHQRLSDTNATDFLRLRWKKRDDGRVFVKEPNRRG